MKRAEFLFFLTSLVCSSVQVEFTRPNFNSKTDGVVELTQKNFKTLVLNSDDTWLVDFEFSGPTCPFCIEISAVIKKAVPLLKQKNIRVGYVDYFSTAGKTLIDMYGITGFPTIYIFGKFKEHPIEFRPYAMNSAAEFVKSVEFYLKEGHPAQGICGQDSVENQESDIYELTDENFEEVVLKCKEPWIVNFYVPDVNVCIQFTPYFEAAAKEFKGRAKFGSFFQVGSKVAESYGVKAICTVKMFPGGLQDGQPVDYNNGAHSANINANFIPWIKTALASSLPAPVITELTSQRFLESSCTNSGVRSCIFFFLAKSDKCDVDCKHNYLILLKEIAAELKAENWAWLWTTEGTQPDFELTFGIQRFPGVLAVDLKSKTFSVTRGTTSESRLKEFLQFFIRGRLPSKNMPTSGFPRVESTRFDEVFYS